MPSAEHGDNVLFAVFAPEDEPEVMLDLEYLVSIGFRIRSSRDLGISPRAGEDAISNSNMVLVFLSASALRSKFVSRMIGYAVGLEKAILPIALDRIGSAAQGNFGLVPWLKVLDAVANLPRYALDRDDYLQRLTRRLPELSHTPDGLPSKPASGPPDISEVEERLVDAFRAVGFPDAGSGADRGFRRSAAYHASGVIEPNGDAAVSASVDTTLKVWDLPIGGPSRPLEGEVHPGRNVERPGAVVSGDEARRLADTVECSVFAPSVVARGDTLLVQVFAHLTDQLKEAGALATLFDPDAVRRASKVLDVVVSRGSRLAFALRIPETEVEDPIQSLVWNGKPEAVQFGVRVSEAHRMGTIIGTITISRDSVPIGHIKFKTIVAAAPSSGVESSVRQVAELAASMGFRIRPSSGGEVSVRQAEDVVRYRRAFISYASPDRAKVLARVQMLRIFQVDAFQDILSLDPGERWERQLFRAIDDCDLFLLFWSSSARESEWVRRETRRALDRKGENEAGPPEIQPVIIEGPPVPAPWEEVAHLHFNDGLIYFGT